jgi:hypothetical protein
MEMCIKYITNISVSSIFIAVYKAIHSYNYKYGGSECMPSNGVINSE